MQNAIRYTLAPVIAAATLALPDPSLAQGADSAARGASRSAELPLRSARTVRFTTDEGTWMSIDVSPDGRTLVFDLVGDIYTLPVAGGKATRLTNGLPFDAQPRWSPDGKSIVFVTDRDGSDDVWVMDADGKNARQITRTDRTQFVSPEFTPDGKYIYFNSSRTGRMQIWRMRPDGSGQEQVTNDASFVDDLGADSLDTVELVMALEEEFEIEIPDEDAEKITTVHQAIDYISERRNKA